MLSRTQKFAIRDRGTRGAALMLALWALFLLGAMVISWALDINSRLAISGNASRVLDAEAMASSGADIALNPLVQPSSPNLHGQMGGRQSYDVQMTGEQGRLDLNWITLNEDPTKLAILRQYLSLKGVDLNDIDKMLDSLLDWVSSNVGLHHLNACPETDEYRPPHAPLTSVEDLKKICGWEKFTSTPGWDADFTVLPLRALGQYRIDLAWASRDVLRALSAVVPGMSDDKVDRFLQLRQGPDGIDGTADDYQFGTGAQGPAFNSSGGGSLPSEVLTTLGLPQQQSNQPPGETTSIANLLTFRGPIFRVVSVGKSGDLTRSVQMIIVKSVGGSTGTPLVMSWKEL
ncbi:MAG: general secretion pathway protein GspK [Verrucomicrobia bacterium]|nr:general secretion pathway protein GspK [Verrucomicrobiota bacterium]